MGGCPSPPAPSPIKGEGEPPGVRSPSPLGGGRGKGGCPAALASTTYPIPFPHIPLFPCPLSHKGRHPLPPAPSPIKGEGGSTCPVPLLPSVGEGARGWGAAEVPLLPSMGRGARGWGGDNPSPLLDGDAGTRPRLYLRQRRTCQMRPHQHTTLWYAACHPCRHL